MEYPKYRSHKEVSAVKIASVDPGADGSLTLYLEGGFDNVVVPHHERKHKPQPEAGWYLVQYADGHVSFSPAKAFEDGYTLVDDGSADEADEAEKSGSDADDPGVAAAGTADNTNAANGLGADADDDDDDDEDEEVADAANNHGEAEAVAD